MNKRTKGILFGILVGIAWGLDGVLMGQAGKIDFLNNWEVAQSMGISRLSFDFSALVSGFFHESFCFVWVALVLLFSKQLKHVFYLLFKTKKGKAAAIAALVGSPIGMSAYLLGIKYATAPYASGISVIYPGIGAILSYLILKEKLKPRAMVGIIISLFGSCMLAFNPNGVEALNFKLGILFAVIAVIGWASEGVIIGIAMKHIKDEDDIDATPQQFLCLRYFISMVAYSLVVIPVIKGYPLVNQVVTSGLIYKYAGIAVLGAITYLSWYKAVDLIGAAMGTALNSTATLWVIIFGALLFGVPVTTSVVIWGTVIVTGVFIFAIEPKKKN